MTSKQTRTPDGPTLRVLAAGALIVASACAAPIFATDTASARDGAQGQAGAPVQCGVATESHFGITTFRPWVKLDRAMPGSYSFALSGGGTAIDQGGSFDGGEAGQSLLGEASVTGPASRYDVELTVTVGGTRYRCQLDATDI